MKYIVVCYAIHERNIASFDSFDKEEDAYSFLKEDAQNTYEEEKAGSEDAILVTEHEGKAILYSCDDEYIWTWEIISI